ncbi:uncharacterized protein [Acropora muricata]|uniref:uncharacterized protein isoform X1 n=1 Tax=Acropora muricata TaxID=159855 RepID=UPI0034E49FDA
MAFCKFFRAIVMALLFGCSVACENVALVSQGRIECRGEGPERPKSDAYIQIQCHGNEQSCYATCDGAISENSNTRFKICKKNGSVCIQSLLDRTVPYVLKVNEAQDLIFERGQCEGKSFLFKEKRIYRQRFYYNYQTESHGPPMRLECSCDDNRLRLRVFNGTNKHHSWFDRL